MNEQGILTELKSFFGSITNSIDLLFDKPLTFIIKLLRNSFSILIIIFVLFALDSFFKWTDHYEEERKLDRIQKINAILEKKDLPLNVVQSLKTFQNQVLSEKNYKIHINNFFYGFFLPHNISFTYLTQSMNTKINKIGSNILNFDWGHFITSSFLIILFLFFSTKQLITGKNLDNRLRPVGYVATFILIGLAITFSNTTHFLNPFDGWFWHSIFNIIFHCVSILLIIASIQIMNDKVKDNREYWQKLKEKY
jgi:hypothetical protein